MKTIKDEHLSILHRVFGWRGGDYLSLAVLVGFSLTDSGRLYEEAELWDKTASALGRGRVLDLGMPKPRGEVLVLGKCFAPQGKPVQAAEASFRVGGLEKGVKVLGDRYFKFGRLKTVLTDPKPFTEMDLTWENAFGGPDFKANPSGKGLVPVYNEQGERLVPLPNVMGPDQSITSPDDRPAPAGLGPLGLDWQVRLQNRGTFDEAWLADRWPGFPDDFDFDYFNLSPPDQRLAGYFTGNEPVLVRGMHPEHLEIRSQLPGLRCRLFVHRRDGNEEEFSEIKTEADTVCLAPHLDLGLVIWHGAAQVSDDEAEDVLNILAFFEPLPEEPRPMGFYQAKLAKAPAEAAAVEPPGVEPPEASPPEAPLLPAVPIPAAVPAIQVLIDEIDQEIAEKQAALDQYLRDHGIDPDKLKRPVIPEAEPEPEEISTDEFMSQLDDEIAEKEEQLDQYLRDKGIEPDELEPPESPPKQTFDSADEFVGFFVGKGVKDQKVLKQVRSLYEEHQALETELEEIIGPEAAGRPEIPELPEAPEAVLPEEETPSAEEAVSLTREEVLAGYAEGRGFSGTDLTGLDLSGIDLSGIDLRGAVLEGVNFSGSNLSRADLSQAVLTGADLSQAVLVQTAMSGVSASKIKAVQADLSGADMKQSDFTGADLSQARLSGADFTGSQFTQAILTGIEGSGASAARARFLQADLKDSKWIEADLTKAEMTGSTMDGADLSRARAHDLDVYGVQGRGVNFQGADLWRSRSGQEAGFQESNFRGANLSDACWEDTDLSGADLSRTRLQKARMNKCQLTEANLTAAQAQGANMAKSDLSGARMHRIDLLDGSLRKARLVDTDCRQANLYNVDFYKSVHGRTDFSQANLDRTLITLFGKKS